MKTEWVHKKLGECLTIGNGCDYKHLQHGDVPVYGTGGVMTYVDKYLYDGETVCIGRKGTINHPIYHNGKIWTVDTLFYTHSFLNVLPKFIYYTFCNIDWNKYNEATGVPSLSKETIYKIEIPIPYKNNKPDLSVQRRIAAILSSADKVIASTQKTIAKYKQIKQGMMEELFNEQCTMNNVQWKKVRFDEFFDMLPNNTLSRDKLNRQRGEYLNIHYGDVLINYPFCLDCSCNDIPYINNGEKFNNAKAIDGDVIFADTAEDDTVGKCVELLNVGNRKIVSGLHTYFCRPKFRMASGYLGYYLNSNLFHDQLLPYIAGSKVSSVNRTSIARTFIFFPVSLAEQCRIASILSGIDAKIAAEEKVLEKYEKVKKGLMERLLNEQCTMNNVQ